MRIRVRHALVVAAVLVFGTLPALPALSQSANPIVIENQQPGTDQWQIPNAGFQVADDVNNQIKGYASAASVNKGGTLTFYVSVNPLLQTYIVDIYRMGWYGGRGARLMLETLPRAGIPQPSCSTVDSTTQLLACNWTASYVLVVPNSWTDGVYLAVLSSAQGYQTYVPFVVRDDARTASLMYQQPSNTYQAYNNWGGKSLYNYNSSNAARAYKVSFDRPYGGDGSGDYFGWEVYTVQWLEQQGYDVTYSADVDAHVNPNRVRSVMGVLIPGHSEYWTKGMYDAVQGARDAGVSLGFLGSNAIYWQVRYEPSPFVLGAQNRVLVCYKTSDPPNPVDPITATSPGLNTGQWRDSPVNRPEQSLIGVQFTSQTGNGWDDTVPYVVSNSTNWVYANTGFTNVSSVPRLTGYEADRQFPQFPQPSSQDLTAAMVANSPYTNVNRASDYHNASVYQALSGSWVFASGSQAWAWGLMRPGFVSAGIQQATTNILNRFVSNIPVAVTQTPTPSSGPSAYRSAIMADGPLGYWRLGEARGTVAADQILTRNGTYANNPALGQPGALFNDPATSVGLNGTSQYVQVPSDTSLNPSTFSVEVWARPTGGAGTYRGVVASRYYPTGWVLYLGASGAWELWVNSGTAMISVAGGTGTLNTWQHLVGTFDGTTARLYVNGVALASGAVTAAYQPQTRQPLEIGQSEPGNNLYFPGQLEEAAVYGTALTPTQVQRHYSVGTTGR